MLGIDVVEITITDEDIKIIRVPRGEENTFCIRFSERYTLSESARINIFRKDNTNIYSIKDKEIEDKNKRLMCLLENADDVLCSTLDNEIIIKMAKEIIKNLQCEINT